MKKIRFVFSALIVVSMFLSLLAAPLSNSNIVKAQTGDQVPQGWDMEITLPAAMAANMDSGEMDLVGAMQGKGLQASREGDILKVSGQGGTDELRRVLFEDIGNGFTLISRPTNLSISLPMVEGQVLTLKLETNITTGYGWELTGSEGVDVAQDGNAQYMTRGDERQVGAPQVVTFIYKASGAGIGKLNLAYKRPFGESEDAKTRINLRLAENPGEVDLSDPSPEMPALPQDDTGPLEGSIPDEPVDGLPTSLDWRTSGIVSPIRDQQTCGSCWAFAATGAFESAVKKGGGPATNLSEQFLVSCNKDGYNCNYGGFGSIALKYYVNTTAYNQTSVGAVLESVKPYTNNNGSCTSAYAHPYKGYSYGWVAGSLMTQPTVTQIKNALYTYGPITAAVCVGPAFQYYDSGVFQTDESGYCSGANHEIMLVGWNDSTQSWILRNSWNTGWGENGYMRIKWGTSRIGIQASYVRYTNPTVPTTVSPSGNIMDKTPTYMWKVVSGATQYQIQVYKGSSKVVDKIYTSSACSGSYCSATPTTALTTAGYTWKVRALKGSWGAYSSARSFTVVTAKPPTTVSPSGTGYDTTPTYKWTKISGATQYQIQAYKGSSKVVDKVYTSSVCSGSYCSATPTTVLAYAGYTWKVRVYINGVWTAYSSAKSFTVAKASTGFNSQFTSNATGWLPVYGTWTLASGYYKTYGVANIFTSAAYNGTYSKLDYQVYMKRLGCSACSNYLAIRGTTTPLDSTYKIWNKVYQFQYANGGSFSVWEINGSTQTALKSWTTTSYINPDSWNTLRVIASGSSLKFYINGHLVWSGTDSSFTSGKVGFGMYRDATSTGNALYVDYATLTTAVSAFATDLMEPLAESGQSYPEWTDPATAPH